MSCGQTGPRLRGVFSRDLLANDLIEPTFAWAQFISDCLEACGSYGVALVSGAVPSGIEPIFSPVSFINA